MAAVLPEDVDQHLGRAVDDPRLLGESGRGCHEPGHLHDAADPIESPEHRGDRGEGVQRGHAGEVGGVLDRDVPAEQAGAGELPVDERQLPGGPHEVAGDDRGHVGTRRRGDGRQGEPQLLEAVGDGHQACSVGRFR